MNNSKRNKVCIPCSLYVLSFYLLINSKDDIDKTHFIFTHTIPENVRRKFRHSHFIDLKDIWHKNKYILSLYTFLTRKNRWPFLFDAEIYGLDFYWDLLRGLELNYIEDCPNIIDIWENSTMYKQYKEFETYSPLKRYLKSLTFGDYYQHPVGTCNLVKTIYTSSPYNKSYHNGKRNIVKNLKEEWENSSIEKKQFILDIFDISTKDFALLRSRKVLLLTQPFYEDGKMSKNKQIDMYRNIIRHYGEENVIIKPHPRDKCDYVKEIPNILYFAKQIPMQLLAIFGLTLDHLVTINSSSALSFGSTVNIDWWAEQMDEDIIGDMGFKTLNEAKSALGIS